ncbi:MAG TPA: glycosyltransferase family 1 protein [Terriglobia bacterium]|nr:glycosyltransferase family 1 protein [Terriglobia bacterium]
MKAGIFVTFAGRDYGGPQTYEETIVGEIAQQDRENEYHVYALEPGAASVYSTLPENARCHVLKPRARWLSVPFSLPAMLLRDRIELLHATVIPPPLTPIPLAFTMHDVTPFARPEFYPRPITLRLRALIQRGIRAARLVICVSQSALDTTRDLFKLPDDRFVVIHHGVNPQFRPVPREQARQTVSSALQLTEPYILHVGHIEKRKNIGRLLEAFYAFRQETRLPFKLVFSGVRNFDTAFVDEVLEKRRLREQVIELGKVPQQLMPAVYSAAEMLAFPSLWEGFGFPVLEAMACGTPVVTSNVASLPEIAGDATLLVDPLRTEEIAAALCRIATDSSLRAQLRQRGIQRAALFTWERAARLTIQAYRRVIGN